LESVYGVNEHQLAEPWVDGEHPLLGPPGFPHDRPGAVAVESAPEWLVGLRHSGHGSILGRTLPDIQRMCGISQ